MREDYLSQQEMFGYIEDRYNCKIKDVICSHQLNVIVDLGIGCLCSVFLIRKQIYQNEQSYLTSKFAVICPDCGSIIKEYCGTDNLKDGYILEILPYCNVCDKYYKMNDVLFIHIHDLVLK